MYKLLIVDDNEIQLQSVLAYINWSEYNIDTIECARDGKEGLEIIKKIKPDIVITDVVMPIMDGIEMTRQAKLVSPNTKYIYMSCHDDPKYFKSAIDNDVASYIFKPIKPDELKAGVEKIISEIKEQKKYSELNKMINESLDVFRENFLYQLLYSSQINMQYLESTIHNLNFHNYSLFIVAKLEITAQTCNIYQLADIIKKQSESCYPVIESETECAIIFMQQSNDKESFMSCITAILKNISDTLKSVFNTEMKAGLSLVHSTLYDARLMLSQASRALENNLACDDEFVFHYKELPMAEFNLDPVKLKDDINVMLDDSSASLNAFMDKYYPADIYLTKGYIKTLCLSVVTSLQFLLIERNLNFNDLFEQSDVVWNKIDNFDTIKNTRQWLYNILDVVLKFLNDSEKCKYEKITRDIMQYIEKNYKTISCVEDITENMYISASYAKRLFKKYTGKTIFDYLLAKRMEEAKKLLQNPYVKVYEVAEEIGYKSKAHFTEIFRKYTGKTPKEFQQGQ